MKASFGFRKSRLTHRRLCHLHERLEARLLLDGAGEYGQLPLSFEINQGQTAPQVNFLAHGSGYGLFLTPTEAVLSLQPSASSAGSSPGAAATASGDALEMQFVGANPGAQATGLDKLAGVTNYLIGNDPSQWHTGVANYGQVEYQNLYAGVNLTYYGNQRQLEYDFTVAAGANPSQIAFHVAGAESVSLDAQGNLVLHTSGGDVIEHAPVIYQQTATGRQAIDGHYTLSDDDRVGFAVGNYDQSQTLVIDPILSYSTYLGGSGGDVATAIAVDAAGEAFVAGSTSSTDFPTTAGALQTSFPGGINAFVAKLNAAGSGLVYCTYLGGSNGGSIGDQANAIAVDPAGGAYVAGTTNSTNFPTTPGALQTSYVGGINAFVAKLNAAGSGLDFSTYLGGSGYDLANAIAVDAAGQVYVAGGTNATNFPTTPDAPQTYNAGGFDAFVSKLNAAGSALVYSTYLGGNGDDQANAIAVDAAGQAYVAGSTTSRNFPTTVVLRQIPGGVNAFVAKLDSAGSGLVYSTYLGGSGAEAASAIAIDAAGEAFVAGTTSSTDFPTTAGALQTSEPSFENAFVAKLNAAGSGLVYSTYLGGSGSDFANAIAVDAAGDAYVTGDTTSANFPTTPGAPQTYNAGVQNAFVAKLNAAGSGLVYSTYLGGSAGDQADAIVIDAAGEAYVAGITFSENFPTTAGALQTTFVGNFIHSESFVFKLATTALNLTALQIAATEGAPFAGTVGFLVDEAQAFDPAGNFTALVGWGDGATSTATLAPYGNGFNLFAAHSYAEDGAYQLTVTVVDADRSSATAAGTATVADAPLSGVSHTAAFTEGAALARSVASFEDDDPKGAVGDYTANIDWGDGQTSPGTVVADGAVFDVTGLHQYVADGNYPITVTVHDVGGAATIIHSTATVADSLSAKPVNLTVYGNKSVTATVAKFTDPDNSLGPTDYTAKITWDDGTTTSGAVTAVGSGPAATFFVAGTHLFGSFAGFHAVGVAITDVDDGSVTTVIDSVLDPPGLTANQMYVLNAYQSAFGTAGTTDTVVASNTLGGWAAKLDAGATTAAFAEATLDSDEYCSVMVGGLYQQYLGRAADAAGLAYWVAQMRNGETDAQIEAAFAGSSEFYQHAGGTDAGWVSAMYQAILGRAADDAGLAYWTGQLAQGASRALVAQGFAASTEREEQLIEDDYFADLGRAADPAGLAYWLNAFGNGLRDEDIIAGFLASEEYYQAHSS